MTDEERRSPARGNEDPADRTPASDRGGAAGPSPSARGDLVGGSGPGPLKDDADSPELGIGPQAAADAAGGGYGTRSGRSSGGTGDGEPGSPPTGSAMDDGTTSGATGAAGAGPTEWLRGTSAGQESPDRATTKTDATSG